MANADRDRTQMPLSGQGGQLMVLTQMAQKLMRWDAIRHPHAAHGGQPHLGMSPQCEPERFDALSKGWGMALMALKAGRQVLFKNHLHRFIPRVEQVHSRTHPLGSFYRLSTGHSA
jgi:hypothetical protein